MKVKFDVEPVWQGNGLKVYEVYDAYYICKKNEVLLIIDKFMIINKLIKLIKKFNQLL